MNIKCVNCKSDLISYLDMDPYASNLERYMCENCSRLPTNDFIVWFEKSKIQYLFWSNVKYEISIATYCDPLKNILFYRTEDFNTEFIEEYKIFCPPHELTIPSILSSLDRVRKLAKFK